MAEWTLPQALYAYIRTIEEKAADARQTFVLTMAAIGSVFSKDGSKIAKRVLRSLDGPGMSAEDVVKQLSEKQKLVLYGIQPDPQDDDGT